MTGHANASDTVTVWRLEDDSGVGAFNAMDWDTYSEFSGLHQVNGSTDLFPTVSFDEELRSDPNFEELKTIPSPAFGCCTLELLREWFPAVTLHLLEASGIDLTEWRVPLDAIARSSRQALFDRARAALVARRPVSALHKSEPVPLAA